MRFFKKVFSSLKSNWWKVLLAIVLSLSVFSVYYSYRGECISDFLPFFIPFISCGMANVAWFLYAITAGLLSLFPYYVLQQRFWGDTFAFAFALASIIPFTIFIVTVVIIYHLMSVLQHLITRKKEQNNY
jgi:hypothetical protein